MRTRWDFVVFTLSTVERAPLRGNERIMRVRPLQVAVALTAAPARSASDGDVVEVRVPADGVVGLETTVPVVLTRGDVVGDGAAVPVVPPVVGPGPAVVGDGGEVVAVVVALGVVVAGDVGGVVVGAVVATVVVSSSWSRSFLVVAVVVAPPPGPGPLDPEPPPWDIPIDSAGAPDALVATASASRIVTIAALRHPVRRKPGSATEATLAVTGSAPNTGGTTPQPASG
jgi:hypothetical protein